MAVVADDTAPDAGKGDATVTDGSMTDGSMDAASDGAMDDVTQTESGTDAGPGTYKAYAIIGGLDRLRIAKTVGGTCFYIQLVSPSNNTGGLTLPNNWGFEFARALQPAAACDPKYLGPITNTFDASSQSGTISFSGNPYPTTITSVMVTLNFANHPMWCPASEVFSATNVMVQ